MIRTSFHRCLQTKMNGKIIKYYFASEPEEQKKQNPPQQTADDLFQDKINADTFDLLKRMYTLETKSPFSQPGRKPIIVERKQAKAFFKCLEKGGSIKQATRLYRMKELPKPVELSEEEKRKISPVHPTSVQILFRDYINNVQVQRKKMRRALQEAKPGAFRRDTILVRQEKDLQSINVLHNPNLFTHLLEIKQKTYDITLNEMLEEKERFDADVCWDKFQKFFNQNIFNFLKDEQFIQIIFRQPSFRKYIGKLPLKFFKQYSKAILDINIKFILRNCKNGQTVFLPILRYAEPNRQGYYFRDYREFSQFLQFMGRLNQDSLLFQYFFFNENLNPLLDYNYFINGILNLSWGGPVNQQQLRKQLSHLLLMRFKLGTNKELQIYLADMFFGSENYDKGILAVVLNILLLQRLAHFEQIGDILEVYKHTFGLDRYKFYFQNELPNILKNMNIKSYYLSYLNGLNYNVASIASQPLKNLTNLDEIFLKSNYICSGQTKINYSPTKLDILTDEILVQNQTPRRLLQEAVINNNYRYVKKKLSQVMGFRNYKHSIVRLAQNKIYKGELQKIYSIRSCLTPEIVQRLAIKKLENGNKRIFRKEVDEYFRNITRDALKYIQLKEPDIKLSRPALAKRFPLRLKTWMISQILKHPNKKAPAQALYLLKKIKPLINQRLADVEGLNLTREERLQKRQNLFAFRQLKTNVLRSKVFKVLWMRQKQMQFDDAADTLKNFTNPIKIKIDKQLMAAMRRQESIQKEREKKMRKLLGKQEVEEEVEEEEDEEGIVQDILDITPEIKLMQKSENKKPLEVRRKEFLEQLNSLTEPQNNTETVYTPKYSFSASNKGLFYQVQQEIELKKASSDSGLVRYLDINRQIDADVQQKELQQQLGNLFNKKIQDHIAEPKTLNLSETQTLKQIFQLDSEKPQQQQQQQILERIQKVSERQPNNLFKKIESSPYIPSPRQYQQEKKQHHETASQIFSSAPPKNQDYAPEINVLDVQLSNYDFTQKAKFQIEQFFKNDKPKAQLVQEIQTFFAGIQASTNNYHLYLISELIKALEETMPEDSLLIFAQIICQVRDQIALDEKIRVKYSTQYGEIEKNYGKYIGQTCTPFSLGSKGYNYLLDFILKDGNYNRLVYKRILAHYSLYETVLYDSVFQKISEITINNKIPQTCAEIIYAFQNKKIAINTTQMRKIASLLYQFKHFEAETEQLIISFYHTYQMDLKFADLKPVIMRLMNLRKRDRYMSLYESLKDQILARKLRQTPSDPVELTKVMTEFKQKQKDQLQQFVRSFANLLLENDLIEEARLVINDSKRIRYQFQVEDYNLWLRSHVNHFEDALKIFHDFELKFPGVYDAKILSTLCFVIQSQQSVFESDDTKTMFSEVVKKYILEKNLALTTELVFDISNTFNKLKEFTNFSNFMKFLLETRYPVIYAHKSLFYKVMNNADQDSIKGLIKSIIDVLFKDEITKKKEQRRSGSQEINEAPKQYDTGSSQKDNPLHIKELATEKQQPKKAKAGKKTRLRGGKSKFNQIETDSVKEKQPEEETKSAKE